MIWVPGTSLSGPVPGAQVSGLKSGPLSASFIGLLRAKCASKIIAIVWTIREKLCSKSCGNSEDQHNNCSSYIFLRLISAELRLYLKPIVLEICSKKAPHLLITTTQREFKHYSEEEQIKGFSVPKSILRVLMCIVGLYMQGELGHT